MIELDSGRGISSLRSIAFYDTIRTARVIARGFVFKACEQSQLHSNHCGHSPRVVGVNHPCYPGRFTQADIHDTGILL
jgi:hypothetical protein